MPKRASKPESQPSPPETADISDASAEVSKFAGEVGSIGTAASEFRRGFYLFVSYDLVNSTKFKSEEREVWPAVIKDFYKSVTNEIGFRFKPNGEVSEESRMPGAEIWKYVGDEVLYFVHIDTVEALSQCVKDAWAVLDTIRRKVESPDFVAKHKPKAVPQPTTKPKVLLSVKASAWIANVGDDGDADKADNLMIRTELRKDHTVIDFLGPEIDAGFRVAKYAERRIVVVSADLAYLLIRKCNIEASHLRLVGHEVLKGVWNDRHYPIIWYHGDWDSYRADLPYDEHLKNKMVEQAKLAGGDSNSEVVRVLGDHDHGSRVKVLDGFGKPQEIPQLSTDADIGSIDF